MVVNITRDGDIAVVTVDNPPVNALGQALRQGLWDAVATLDAAADVRAVVLICAGRTFIAGADVTEFGKPPVPPHLPDLVDRIEGAAKPWVAAIHGSALGGGLEVAMGCRFRVALETAALGLPEVGLGIVPGASGTVRTPRLLGVAAAVELVTSGRPVKAERARSMGVVDAVVAGDLRAAAVAFVRTALEAPLPLPVSARPVTAPDAAWWEDQRRAIAARAKGEVAPLRALDCLRVAAERPFAEALAHERAAFLALRGSDQAAALRHVFFAERAAPRPAHVTAAPRPLRSAVVVGGGVGLASALRSAGLSVALVAEDDAAVLRGPQTGGSSAGAMAALIGEADLVIVAAEGALATPAILGRLGRMSRADAVLAVPTGAGDPHPDPHPDAEPDAETVANPARILGLNVFGPTAGVALLEIVPTSVTAPETLATGFALARVLGGVPVQTGPGGGSIGHRLRRRTRAAAEDLIRQGLDRVTVDAAMRAYGFALGPFEAWDGGDPVPSGVMPGRADLSDADIAARLTAAMAEEGYALLAEGVALRSSDIDLVAVHGQGYPRWRGGPMFEARRQVP